MRSTPAAGVIHAVVCQHIRTARRMRIEGRWFADCTGDAAVGFLAGADTKSPASSTWAPATCGT